MAMKIVRRSNLTKQSTGLPTAPWCFHQTQCQTRGGMMKLRILVLILWFCEEIKVRD